MREDTIWGDPGVMGTRPTAHAVRSQPVVFSRPAVHPPTAKAVAQAKPAQAGSRPGPANPPIGRGSGADVNSPANVSRGQATQDPVSRARAEIVGYKKQLTKKLRTKDPEKWAKLQKNLGFAYARLGIISRNSEELKNALAAFDQALTVFKPGSPKWAEFQYYRGIVLIQLGEILLVGKKELKTALEDFKEALKVEKEALKVETNDRTRAEIQNFIGIALQHLAEITKDVDETKAFSLLTDAAKAYSEAVKSEKKALDAIIKNATGRGVDKHDNDIDTLNQNINKFQGNLNAVKSLGVRWGVQWKD